jgi:hypothetical protein
MTRERAEPLLIDLQRRGTLSNRACQTPRIHYALFVPELASSDVAPGRPDVTVIDARIVLDALRDDPSAF